MSDDACCASSFPWTVAGTLYDSASGAKAIAGATIKVTNANGKVVSIVTSSN